MVSQRCQVAGKPRAVAERSLAEFDGCFSVAKVLTCPLESQILQNIHLKVSEIEKTWCLCLFSPWTYL